MSYFITWDNGIGGLAQAQITAEITSELTIEQAASNLALAWGVSVYDIMDEHQLIEALAVYAVAGDLEYRRDQFINNEKFITVSVGSVTASSYIDNNSRNALTGYMIGNLNDPDDNITVDWTFNGATQNIQIDVVQSLQALVIWWQNKAFKAVAQLKDIHSVTPYPNSAAAIEEFNTLMED